MSIRIAIYGYGNLGKGVELAVRNNPDMELVGVFTRRDPQTLKIKTPGVKVYGADEIFEDEDQIVIYGAFESFGAIQKYLEDNQYSIVSGEFERIPTDTKELTPEQRETIDKLLEKLEEDEDVTNVYHNIKE